MDLLKQKKYYKISIYDLSGECVHTQTFTLLPSPDGVIRVFNSKDMYRVQVHRATRGIQQIEHFSGPGDLSNDL